MSVILVVEQDASYAERIVETLKQEGWDARRLADRNAAIEAANSQMPRLVIASASQPEGTNLLRSFSRQEGGPGSVALIPVGVAQQASPADFQADEVLAKPFSDDDLKQIVRRCLNTPPAPAPPKIAKKSKQLTSAEIFGDVLAEVEAEAKRAKARRPARAKKEAAEDLDKKLEETLSGVLPIGGRLRRPNEAPAPPAEPPPTATPRPTQPTPRAAGKPRNDLPTESEIDDLLDQTLSSLELPQRTRKEKRAPDAGRPVEIEKPPAADEPFDPGPKPDPFSSEPDSLFPPLPAVPEPKVPVAEAPSSRSEPAPTESLGFEPTDTFELEDPAPPAAPASESANASPDPWQGIEPPPDLYPSSFEAGPEAPAADDTTGGPSSTELLQPLEPLEELPLPSESGSAPAGPAPSPAADDAFSFTDAFVPPAPEATGNDGVPSDPLSFTDTFIPPDPKSTATRDAGPVHEDSFPSYEPPATSSRSFLDDSVDVAGAAVAAAPEASESAPVTEEAPSAKEEGQIFGEYTLLDKIATGGMAEVWRARRRGVEGFQKTVAIKKILGHLTDSPDFVNMFIDEAKLAAQLNHNNIIQIYDLGKEGEDFFIAMEHVDGKDLRSILSTGKELGQPLPVGLALLIVASLARALDYAHRRRDFEDRPLGLVHRDVSPQNVLISYEGEIKLCDFGIVKAVSKASTTQMGALKGKLQYMSPEQAWGKKVDGRSDIFSVGSVLFEVLTGTKLFTGDNEISVLDAVRECKIRSPREVVPDLPPAIDDIVQKALTKAPEDRYQTAGDLEADLMSVLNTLKPTPGANDLATYLGSIFQQPEPQFPSYEVSKEPEPAAEEADGTQKAPAGTPAKEDSSKSPVKTILFVVLSLLILGALGFAAWKLTSGSQEPATAPAAAPPPPAPAPAQPPEAAADEAETTSPEEQSVEPASDSEAGQADTEGSGDGEPGAEGDDQNLDLERLVEDGLAEQEELLQKRLEEEYEARRRQLQEEISRTQQSFQEQESDEPAPEPPPDSRR